MKNLLLISAILFSLSAQAQNCKATTKKGEPCSRKGTQSGYCFQHNPNTPKCKGITKAGKQCKINATKGTAFCHIHKSGK